jgi:hypothetical protein
MKLKSPAIIFKYLKQFLLLVALVYAFSNCHVKKSVLHFAGIGSVALSQKSLTQLPVQGLCSFCVTQKSSFSQNAATPQLPLLPNAPSYCFQIQEKTSDTLPIHPAFEFNKSSTSYPPIFIVFKKLKITPLAVS